MPDTKTELTEKVDAAIETYLRIQQAEAQLARRLDEIGGFLANELNRRSCTRGGFWLGWVGDENHIEMQIKEEDNIDLNVA